MNLDKKKEIVAELHEKFLKSQVVFVTDYKGLKVSDLTDLRRKLRDGNSEYRVVKNSLLVRASENTPIAVIKEQFKGTTAIAMTGKNPVDPAKILSDFAKTNDKLKIRAAALDGKFLDFNGVKALAALPSREVLLSQLLSVMNGVPTAFVRVLNGVPQKMMNLLNAIKEKKEAA
jgi:large subunit ribosomal protein L10